MATKGLTFDEALKAADLAKAVLTSPAGPAVGEEATKLLKAALKVLNEKAGG